MGLYALEVRNDALVAADLAAAGVPHHSLTYTADHWDGRKSIVVERQCPLLPGYLLVGVSSLPHGVTRRWHRWLLDHASGRPLRVPDAEALLARCEKGDFDVRRTTPHFNVGSRVHVTLLDLSGEIVSRVRREYLVRLDSSGREVRVGQPGISLLA